MRLAAVNVWKLCKLGADAGSSRGHAKLGEEVVVVDESLPVMQRMRNTLSSMTCLPLRLPLTYRCKRKQLSG